MAANVSMQKRVGWFAIKSFFIQILAIKALKNRTIVSDVPELMYPINILRNVARRGGATPLHLVADVENIFSRNFTAMVRNEAEALLLPRNAKRALAYR